MSRAQAVILIIYGSLLALCVILLISAEFVGPSVRQTLGPLASDGFKTTLAALIGALSVLMGTAKQ